MTSSALSMTVDAISAAATPNLSYIKLLKMDLFSAFLLLVLLRAF